MVIDIDAQLLAAAAAGRIRRRLPYVYLVGAPRYVWRRDGRPVAPSQHYALEDLVNLGYVDVRRFGRAEATVAGVGYLVGSARLEAQQVAADRIRRVAGRLDREWTWYDTQAVLNRLASELAPTSHKEPSDA